MIKRLVLLGDGRDMFDDLITILKQFRIARYYVNQVLRCGTHDRYILIVATIFLSSFHILLRSFPENIGFFFRK